MSHIRNNQYPYRSWNKDFPNVSFPDSVAGVDFPELNIWWVQDTAKPTEYDPKTQYIVEGQPIQQPSVTKTVNRYVRTDTDEYGKDVHVYEAVDQEYEVWYRTWRIVDRPHPTRCTRRQGRLALVNAGKLELIEQYIERIKDPVTKLKARVEYEADVWEYDNPTLQKLWVGVGGTYDGLQDLFRTANTL